MTTFYINKLKQTTNKIVELNTNIQHAENVLEKLREELSIERKKEDHYKYYSQYPIVPLLYEFLNVNVIIELVILYQTWNWCMNHPSTLYLESSCFECFKKNKSMIKLSYIIETDRKLTSTESNRFRYKFDAIADSENDTKVIESWNRYNNCNLPIVFLDAKGYYSSHYKELINGKCMILPKGSEIFIYKHNDNILTLESNVTMLTGISDKNVLY
jgi:hypothetical protein